MDYINFMKLGYHPRNQGNLPTRTGEHIWPWIIGEQPQKVTRSPFWVGWTQHPGLGKENPSSGHGVSSSCIQGVAARCIFLPDTGCFHLDVPKINQKPPVDGRVYKRKDDWKTWRLCQVSLPWDPHGKMWRNTIAQSHASDACSNRRYMYNHNQSQPIITNHN